LNGKAAALAASLLVASFVATGCWNRRELNTMSILLGAGIDKVGNQYRLSAQVVDPGEVAAAKGSSSARSPVTMYKATGSTLFEAFRKMTLTSPRKIYASHIRILVIGENLAREGISGALDLLSRDPEMRTDYDILIARNTTAENVLKIMTPLEKIPANKLFDSLTTSERAWAPTTTFTLNELIEQLVAKGQDPVLTGVIITGNPKVGEEYMNVNQIDPAVKLKLSTLAAFKGSRMVGWLTRDESKGYNLIMGNVRSTAVTLPCPNGGKLALEVLRTKSKIKGGAENGRPTARIQLKVEANVAEVACIVDLDDPRTIRSLERQAEEEKRELMVKAVKAAQKRYRADIFGFGEAIYRARPRYWQRISKDWKEHFPDMKVEYDIEVLIRRTGTTGKSFVGDIRGD